MKLKAARRVIKAYNANPAEPPANLLDAYTRIERECPLSQKALKGTSVAALKKMAKAHGKKGYSKLGKDELITLLAID